LKNRESTTETIPPSGKGEKCEVRAYGNPWWHGWWQTLLAARSATKLWFEDARLPLEYFGNKISR